MSENRRMVILTEGNSNDHRGKTAVSVIRYNTEEVLAILDSTEAGKTSQELFNCGGDIPVVANIDEVENPGSLLIGIAPAGGKLPPSWRAVICQALNNGMHIISGLHEFLSDDEEFATLAEKNNVRIEDIRKNNFKQVATRQGINETCYRVHTVGHDCAIGKMVSSLEIDKELNAQGHDSAFVATGQTGIMITGSGLPMDCIVGDFLNGAGEELVRQHQDHDIMLIEGQGSIIQPLYSPVTLGILHGCMPDSLILCYATHRNKFVNTDIDIPSLSKFIELYEGICNPVHPCKVIGIAMNSRGETDEFYEAEKKRVFEEVGLPVSDVIREGAAPLIPALLEHKKSIGK